MCTRLCVITPECVHRQMFLDHIHDFLPRFRQLSFFIKTCISPPCADPDLMSKSRAAMHKLRLRCCCFCFFNLYFPPGENVGNMSCGKDNSRQHLLWKRLCFRLLIFLSAHYTLSELCVLIFCTNCECSPFRSPPQPFKTSIKNYFWNRYSLFLMLFTARARVRACVCVLIFHTLDTKTPQLQADNKPTWSY